MLTLDKDESNWEVMSSLSSKSEKGYKRVLTRLMKKSNQLNMVLNGKVGRHLLVFERDCFFFFVYLQSIRIWLQLLYNNIHLLFT